jgi:2,4-dienoyl-CoA reductase-like NADH-dependent reductase (Old Yellow Enzyme family)
MLFKKLLFKKFEIKNRIVLSPMCQYSAKNGCPTLWHYQHLSSYANSGISMVMLESTAVNKAGMITHADLAIHTKKQISEIKKLRNFLKNINKNLPVGIQISHSGRKGSSNLPWGKEQGPLKKKDKSWRTIAPSPIPRSKSWPTPKEASLKDIKNIIKSFRNAAVAANKCNFDCLEIHMAHGYLLHEFMSPISNKRNDTYGGNLENRCRLLFEISKEVRKVWPEKKLLGARITGTDHLKHGLKLNDSIYLAKNLEKIGLDYICVSSGGIIPKTQMKFKDAFRSSMSKEIKRNISIPVRSSGIFNNLSLVNKLIKNKFIDFVAIGRPLLKNPRWIYEITKNKQYIPSQYLRGY